MMALCNHNVCACVEREADNAVFVFPNTLFIQLAASFVIQILTPQKEYRASKTPFCMPLARVLGLLLYANSMYPQKN